MPSSQCHRRRSNGGRAIEVCEQAGVQMMTVPSFHDLVSGHVTVSQLRRVELEDLLGRDPVVLRSAGFARMVTGSSRLDLGSRRLIGSELGRCRVPAAAR